MSGFARRAAGRRPIRVALVNNMPDSAFVDTEEQFRRMVVAGSDGVGAQLELYTITEIPRPDKLRSVIRERYQGLEDLWRNPPDALIVTGTEPARAELRDEPCWPYLTRLLEWAASSVPTTLLSCLAAHASILLFDGIERVPRSVKCSGVFTGLVGNTFDPLASGLRDAVPIPHSRVNDVPEAAMLEAGYRIVIGTGPSRAGWAIATRQQGDSLFVLCQGHPEYATLSLLQEYRRDVRRFLFGDGAVPYPRVPEGYLCAEAVRRLEAFAWQAQSSHSEPDELWDGFPFDETAVTIKNTWAPMSATLYANWLGLARTTLPIAA